MLKRFISYYRSHRRLFILDMLASLAVSLVGILYPIITRLMLNDLIPEKRYRTIILCGAGLLLLYIVRMLLNYFIQFYGHVMGVRMQAQMRSDMFRHLERLPYSFYDNHETGKIMSRMTNDLQDISELAHHGPENLITSTVSVIVSFTYLCTINWKLTLTIFICIPFLLAAALVLRRKMREAFRQSRISIAQINAALESSISGIRVTKAFTNQAKEEEKFEEGNRSYIKARSEAYRAMGQFHSTTSFITDVFNVIVLVAGGLILFGAFGGEVMQLGDYTAFVTSISLFITPVMTLINFMEQYQTGVTGFERFVEIMDEPVEQDAPDATPIEAVRGHIEFRDLTYGYEDGKPVLDRISLDIRPGETFALVGPSGGGKTTIARLIPRFFDVQAGAVLLGGRDVRSIPTAELMEQISFVFQEVRLFKKSIRDNIRAARPDATEAEILHAAQLAQCSDILEKTPGGLDAVIGAKGVYLSGGEMQRIALARAILKDAPIVVLDEASSFADPENEAKIQKAFEALMKGKTVLMIAHRLSTVRNMDRILVIRDGEIAEEGKHDELLEKGGVYAAMWEEYQKAAQWKVGGAA